MLDVPWLRHLVTSLSQERSQFSPGLLHVWLLVYTASLRRSFPRVLLVPLNDIILPMLHTHLHVTITLITRTSGRSLGTLTKQCFFLEYRWASNWKLLSYLWSVWVLELANQWRYNPDYLFSLWTWTRHDSAQWTENPNCKSRKISQCVIFDKYYMENPCRNETSQHFVRDENFFISLFRRLEFWVGC